MFVYLVNSVGLHSFIINKRCGGLVVLLWFCVVCFGFGFGLFIDVWIGFAGLVVWFVFVCWFVWAYLLGFGVWVSSLG